MEKLVKLIKDKKLGDASTVVASMLDKKKQEVVDKIRKSV